MPTYGNISGAQKEIKPWYINKDGAQILLNNFNANKDGAQIIIYTGNHCWAKYKSYYTGSSRYGDYQTGGSTGQLSLLNIEHGEGITDYTVTYGTGFSYNNGSFTLTGTDTLGRMEEWLGYSNYDLDKLLGNYIIYQDDNYEYGVYHLSSRTAKSSGVYYADAYYTRGIIEYLYTYSFVGYVYSENENAYPSGSAANYWGNSVQTIYIKQY